MGKYLCDIDDLDKQGNSIKNDRLGPGGRRRQNGTLSALAYNFQKIPDDMIVMDCRNKGQQEPTFKDEIVDRLQRFIVNKIVEVAEKNIDSCVDCIERKLKEGWLSLMDQRREYKALRREGYFTRAEKLLAERRAEELKISKVIDFEARRKEIKAV